ncbi:relaxase/Mobilization nuclease domain protein [Ochrobactrum quorumnocens]|uniref:Relaxase/Mobilization nuclease domain protein n=1 Tax=Ochrobactrum quorumnocens TaxID=271865 RepID=A0A248U950_9HYPH|nr:relaxase/mobilization nuclease domain-containing protein [[Ochrobactrum] quorumnocens]ASV83214.1 relaxase/Mobilization nuclease domain protein [[Ochrobactrum] quorumnocens]
MDMIGGIHKHGRTTRDSANLFRHLTKDAKKIEIVNSVATSLDDLMSDLALMRDATKADAAFYHVFLSPSSDMSDEQLRIAAQTIVAHMGAENNPYAIIYHDKDRRPGGGNRHVHIVIGRVDSSLRVLENKFEKIRLETAVRICEYEAGEPPVFGRHYNSSIKWLEQHRPEVADWLYNHYGNDGQKPNSSASPDKRQSLERQGVNLSGVKELLQKAYSEASDGQSFADNVRKYGMQLEVGQKSGVYIVKLADVEVGSVDRLLKLKRADVQKLLSNINFKKEISNERAISSNSETREGNLRQSATSRPEADATIISTVRREDRKQRESASEHTRDFGSTSKLKSHSACVVEQNARPLRRSGIEFAQETIATAALAKIQINVSMRENIDFITSRVESSKKENPEIWKISLLDKIRRRFSKAFIRLKECIEMMKMCAEDNEKRFTEADKRKLKEPVVSIVHKPDRSYTVNKFGYK